MTFRVAYLGILARRTYLDGSFEIEPAIKAMRGLKRQGRTTWIEDENGNFVAVPGAARKPSCRQ